MKKDSGNPYIGLRPFDVDESILFFGRNDQSLELLQRLHQHHFVAVVGSSGSGKSSLLRAGLIPALKAGYLIDDSDGWFIAMMKPGDDPLHNLIESILKQIEPPPTKDAIKTLAHQVREEGADALLQRVLPHIQQQKNNFFLLVDQFEELFRFAMNQADVNKKDEAIDFVNIMLELTQRQDVPFYVVITMRSDFIGDCAQFYGLPEAMNQSQYLVPRLSRLQLKTVIEGPAQLYGLKYDPVLTSKLLNDLGKIKDERHAGKLLSDPGKVKDELPILQHALMRICDFEINVNKSGLLDMEDYVSIGGIEKALSIHADEALQGLSEKDLLLVKKIFQALTTIDDNGRKIRRMIRLSELAALTGNTEEEIQNIIKLFIQDKRSFLVVSAAGSSGDSNIDISHESLIRQWDTLGTWVEEEAESSSMYLQLAESAELYNKKKKDLLTGSELQLMLEWNNKYKPSATWANRYREGSNKYLGYLYDSEKEQLAKKLIIRNAKLKRNVIISTLCVLALVALFFFWIENRKETASRGYGMYLHAFIQLDKDPTLALRLAQESLLRNPDSNIETFARIIYGQKSFYRIISRQDTGINAISISPDGRYIAMAIERNKAILCDTSGKVLQEFIGHTGEVFAITFSPDGKAVLTASKDETVRLWDLKGNNVKKFLGHKGDVNAVAFSPDGTQMVSGGADNTVRLWNLSTGQESMILRGHLGAVYSVCISPDGKLIVSGSADSSAILWRISGAVIYQYRHHSTNVMSVKFSPDGKKILTGSLDGTAALWNLDAEVEQEVIAGFGIDAVAFSPDGKSFITGAANNRATLWNIKGKLLQELTSTTDAKYYGIKAVTFTPDGTAVLTGSLDGSLRAWDIKARVIQEFKDPVNGIQISVFSPDGKYLLTNYGTGKLRLWNLQGKIMRDFDEAPVAINTIAFAPKGGTIAAGYMDGSIRTWNLEGKLIKTNRFENKSVMALAFSPDGTNLLAAYDTNIARIWELKSNNYIQLTGHHKEITSVAFAADGSSVYTGSMDSTVIQWTPRGKIINRYSKGTAPVSAIALSPDGKYILTGAGSESKARLMDNTGKVIQIFSGHILPIKDVAFSPDGNHVITGSFDNAAIVWDLQGNIVQVLYLHTQAVNSVAFSPDGKTIATGSADNHVYLWKTAIPLADYLKSNKLEPLTNEQKEFYGIK